MAYGRMQGMRRNISGGARRMLGHTSSGIKLLGRTNNHFKSLGISNPAIDKVLVWWKSMPYLQLTFYRMSWEMENKSFLFLCYYIRYGKIIRRENR